MATDTPAGASKADSISADAAAVWAALTEHERDIWDHGFITGCRETEASLRRADVDSPRWRLLYTGPRLITDRAKVHADLDEILAQHPRLLVRHGAARSGGDLFAVEWVRLRQSQGCDVIADPRPAPFHLLSKIAGPMRNAYMVGLGADECLAHIREGSTGSSGCATFAKWAGIPVTPRRCT